MKRVLKKYLCLLIISIGIGDGGVIVAASELAGVTDARVRITDDTDNERMQPVQERGKSLKKRVQRRLASQYSTSHYGKDDSAKDDSADVSLDTFILFLKEAMRLVTRTRPADSDTQDKMDAWRDFQKRLIRESTRREGAELVFD